jgi:hypothetical protein
MMTEGFLYFIIGARDALLQKINKSFNLGLDEDEVDFRTILRAYPKINNLPA